MAEELPPSTVNPYEPPDAQPQRRRMSLTRMILLPLLVVAIGSLAFDVFHGRLPQKRAFNLVNEKLLNQRSDDSDDAGGMFGASGDTKPAPLTPDGVHELLGRQPDESEKRAGNVTAQNEPDVELQPIVVETYRFRGIVKSFNVVVTYLEKPARNNRPATTDLLYVRKE